MTAKKKHSTQYPGVRYYEHPVRKQRNGQPDRFYSLRYRVNGRLIEETLGWATEGWTAEKAYQVRASLRNSQRTGQGPQRLSEAREDAAREREAAVREAAEDRAANMLLQDFFDAYYLPQAKRSKRSWLTDKQRFDKVIRPALGLRPLRSVTRRDIQRMLDGLVDQGAAASTVKQYRAILSHLYNMASQEECDGRRIFEGVSPVQGVRVPVIRNARERFLTAEEARLLIEGARALPSRDLHDCIVLSLNTGLRMGELRRLEWPDVDLVNAMVTVRDEAQRKPGGKVPLNASAMGIFRDRLASRKGPARGLVFPAATGGDGLRGNLTNAFRSLVDKLGLNDGLDLHDRARRIVFHTLRHTFASWLALNGTDIYRIQKLMRHKSITMTMRYAHLITDATRQAVHDLRPPTAVL